MAKLTMLKPRLATIDTRIARPPPKVGEAYYGTADHKRWAADVKRQAGGLCQDPKHVGDRLADDGIADHTFTSGAMAAPISIGETGCGDAGPATAARLPRPEPARMAGTAMGYRANPRGLPESLAGGSRLPRRQAAYHLCESWQEHLLCGQEGQRSPRRPEGRGGEREGGSGYGTVRRWTPTGTSK
jgi:5-methylcytosine-specific restriction enzyme A